MRLIANGINKDFFASILPNKGTEVDGVLAAIAYGDDKTELLQNCLNNRYRLDIWMRYDHTVPVSPSFLQKLLKNINNNVFCKLVPDVLHSKIIWWKGYGAYIGSANLTERAWYSNIEAGVFLTEDELISGDMLEQVERFFEELQNLPKGFDLTQEIINEQIALRELRDKTLGKDLDNISIKRRSIPEWGGLSSVDSNSSNDRRKESFKQEWFKTLSFIRGISELMHDYRPCWVAETTPIYWQVDQFLHAFYSNIVRQKDRTSPYEDYYLRNKLNPQAALISALAWYRDQPTPKTNEDYTLNVRAPLIRSYLAKDKLLALNSEELAEILNATHSTSEHVSKISPSQLGRPEVSYLSKEDRIPLFAEMLLKRRNKQGKSILELLYFVLYGGKPEAMWERIYQAGKSEDYNIKHYGINSIAEIAGWAQPETTPPRNGRTSKALRALGYPVSITI